MSSISPSYFLINSLEFGWAERVVIRVSETLISQRPITIITLKDVCEFSLPAGVKYQPLLPIKNNLLMVLMMPYYIYALRKILPQYQSGVSFLEIANFVHILSKKQAIISSRIALWFFTGPIGFCYRILIRLLYPKAGHIICNSDENTHQIREQLTLRDDQVSTIKNPYTPKVLTSLASSARELSEQHIGKIIFVSTARLVWQKHHDTIVHALWSLREYATNFHYIIIGDGPQRWEIEKLVQELWLQQYVTLIGKTTDVESYLSIATHYINASSVEGYPNSLLEAIWYRLPIITTVFTTGVQEIIFWDYQSNRTITTPCHGENGVILSRQNFTQELRDLYPQLTTMTSQQVWLEWHDIQKIVSDFQRFL